MLISTITTTAHRSSLSDCLFFFFFPFLLPLAQPKLAKFERKPKHDNTKWVNRQRTLVFSSRGISYRVRHVLEDVSLLSSFSSCCCRSCSLSISPSHRNTFPSLSSSSFVDARHDASLEEGLEDGQERQDQRGHSRGE